MAVVAALLVGVAATADSAAVPRHYATKTEINKYSLILMLLYNNNQKSNLDFDDRTDVIVKMM